MFFEKGVSVWKSKKIDASLSKSASGYNVYMSETKRSDVSWDGMTSSTYNTSTKRYTSQTLYLNYAKSNTWNSDGAL